MKKFIKNNIVGFILGTIIFGGIVGVSAYSIFANDIVYTPSDSTWKKSNGEDITNVKDAIDELYTKANNSSNCEDWEKIDGVLDLSSNFVSTNSAKFYKCGNVCRISFGGNEGNTNINYKIIKESNYYPIANTDFSGIGGDSGFIRGQIKIDGNLIITTQSRSATWASGDVVYICNN